MAHTATRSRGSHLRALSLPPCRAHPAWTRFNESRCACTLEDPRLARQARPGPCEHRGEGLSTALEHHAHSSNRRSPSRDAVQDRWRRYRTCWGTTGCDTRRSRGAGNRDARETPGLSPACDLVSAPSRGDSRSSTSRLRCAPSRTFNREESNIHDDRKLFGQSPKKLRRKTGHRYSRKYVVPIIEEHLERFVESGLDAPVFTGDRGRPLSRAVLQKAWQRLSSCSARVMRPRALRCDTNTRRETVIVSLPRLLPVSLNPPRSCRSTHKPRMDRAQITPTARKQIK